MGTFISNAGTAARAASLAYDLWSACYSAPGEFQELSRELGSIQIILRKMGDDIDDPSSLLRRHGSAREAELRLILDNAKAGLNEIHYVVAKYESLSLANRRNMDRLGFSTHDLGDLRQKLMVHTAAIHGFYDSLHSSSLARIEVIVEDLARRGPHEPTVVSMRTADQAAAYKLLKQELLSEGITVEEIHQYRIELGIFVKQLQSLEVVEDGIEPPDSISPWDSASAVSPSGAKDTHLEQTQQAMKTEPIVAVTSLSESSQSATGTESDHDSWSASFDKRVTSKSTYNKDDLDYGAARMRNDSFLQKLKVYEVGMAADVDWKRRLGDFSMDIEEKALIWASCENDIPLASYLLWLGTNVNIGNARALGSAISHTIKKKNEKMTKLLLESDASPTLSCVYDGKVTYPLSLAVAVNCPAIINLLIEHGASVNPVPSDYNYLKIPNLGFDSIPLHTAAASGFSDSMKLLLKANAQVDRFWGRFPSTALMQAAKTGQLKCVHTLLEHGANVQLADKFGGTALHYAQHCPDVIRRVAVITALLEAGAEPLARRRDGRIPLLENMGKGFEVVAQMLEPYGYGEEPSREELKEFKLHSHRARAEHPWYLVPTHAARRSEVTGWFGLRIIFRD